MSILNDTEHYEKFYDSLKINAKKQNIKNNDDDHYGITLRRVNEHSYIVSFDNKQEEKKFQSDKSSTLTDIHTKFLHNKENLLINEGFIHIKEYIMDGYECRCHEHKNFLNDQDIDSNRYSIDYKLEF